MSTITITIKDMKLSLEEAKALYEELHKLFGKHIPYYPYQPFTSPTTDKNTMPWRQDVIYCKDFHNCGG